MVTKSTLTKSTITQSTPLSALAAHLEDIMYRLELSAALLAGLPPAFFVVVWSWLLRALFDTTWELAGLVPPSSPALTPPVKYPPKLFVAEALRITSLEGLRRLLRGEARFAIEALEIVVLSRVPQPEVEEVLAAHCARMGQVYLEMERRLGYWCASPFLIWELRILRHRGSRVAAPLAFG